jgi:BolA protein
MAMRFSSSWPLVPNYAASRRVTQGKVMRLVSGGMPYKCSRKTEKSMQLEAQMREKLIAAFLPTRLAIVNESHKHAHHAAMKGAANTGETHFSIAIVSDRFAQRSRVERHRMVHQVLADELAGPVHALAVKAQAPDELDDGT